MDTYNLNNKSIFVIEDEVPISNLVCYAIKKEGIKVTPYYTAQDALRVLDKGIHPDLIMLDLMLPDMNGFDVCKEILKKIQVPVILLTARNNIVDKVLGLEIGADDYITKPFDILELVARVRTALRRANNNNKTDKIMVHNHVEIYKDERKVLKSGECVKLTPKEYELLLFLAENRRKVYSRTQLLNDIWGYDFMGDTRTVDIHILRLRKKLDSDDSTPIIETVFGVGYKIAK